MEFESIERMERMAREGSRGGSIENGKQLFCFCLGKVIVGFSHAKVITNDHIIDF